MPRLWMIWYNIHRASSCFTVQCLMFLDQEEEEAPHRVYKFTITTCYITTCYITTCYPCEQNIPYGCVENFLNEMTTVYIPIHP